VLKDFYIAFATISFTLLGLWFIVVQTRHAEWRGSAVHRRRAFAVSLHFALPGVMGLLSLIDPNSRDLWRAAFALIAVIALAPSLVGEVGIGLSAGRVEAILLTFEVFLGANVAWLLMFDDVASS
jgi:hypothetical protein